MAVPLTSAGLYMVESASDSADRAVRTMGSWGVGLHKGHLLRDRGNLTLEMASPLASHLESWQSESLWLDPGLELDPRLEHLPSTLPSFSFHLCKSSCRRTSRKAACHLSSISLSVKDHGGKVFKGLTTRQVSTLTILAGPTSFFSFDPVGIFVGSLFDLVIVDLTGGHVAF